MFLAIPFSYGFPMVFRELSHFPIGFPMFFHFPKAVPIIFLWFSHFPMGFPHPKLPFWAVVPWRWLWGSRLVLITSRGFVTSMTAVFAGRKTKLVSLRHWILNVSGKLTYIFPGKLTLLLDSETTIPNSSSNIDGRHCSWHVMAVMAHGLPRGQGSQGASAEAQEEILMHLSTSGKASRDEKHMGNL